MKTLDFARKRLDEEEAAYQHGNENSLSDLKYWAAYIDGARALKNEFVLDAGATKQEIVSAITTLEIMATNLVGAMAPLEESDPETAVLSDRIAAIDLSQKVLRQVLEVMKS
ncbi:MAG: hypothetical protein IJV16_07310 [Lachnospiraceae bacterium]|nr:hypothetical protein [Lachnospiraceae bacterium]